MSIITEIEVPIGEHLYRIERMPAFDQMNVAAECRDIISALALLKRDRAKAKLTEDEYDRTTRFMIMSRGGMTAEKRTEVVSTCLAQVLRKSGVGWQRVLSSSGTLQFADIELEDIAQLLYKTFEHNKLLDFFSVGPSDLNGPNTQDGSGQSSEGERTG